VETTPIAHASTCVDYARFDQYITLVLGLVKTSHPGTLTTPGNRFILPAVIADQGDKAAERFFTFLRAKDMHCSIAAANT
jgi:hypothetical protein